MTERARWGMLLRALILGWIVILLWMPATVEAAVVDLWAYYGNHSGLPVCFQNPGKPLVCKTDGYTDPVTFVSERVSGFTEVVKLQNGALYDIYDGSLAGLRCFSNGPSTCNGIGAPFNVPRMIDLPLHTAPIVDNRVNNYAGEVAVRPITKATFWVNTVDPESCSVLGTQGTITHSLFGYIIPSKDFGGVLGVRRNLVVLEAVSGYTQPDQWPRNGMRLERYYLDPLLGVVQSEAWEDSRARAGLPANGDLYDTFVGRTVFNVSPGTWGRLPLAAPCGVNR